jgi:uncharacterized protein
VTIHIDIGHPAHVHYFRNAVKEWKKRGHQVVITARDRAYVKELLDYYGLQYTNRGKGSDSLFGKFLYMLLADMKLLWFSILKKPDLHLSFTSPYAAQVSALRRKPHICFSDTEHIFKMHSRFTYPFSDVIITPDCYELDHGLKHVRLKNVLEGLYLGEKHFQPDQEFISRLKGPDGQDYVILRFVAWNAFHDVGHSGLTSEVKRELVKLLSQKYKVYVSAEGGVPPEFSDYAIDIDIHKMHDALAGASMYVGESGTMASESAFLGVYSVYINSLPLMSYLRLEQDNGILKHFQNSVGLIGHIEALLQDSNLKGMTLNRSEKMKENFVDATDFLVEFVEGFDQKQFKKA